MIDQFMLTLSVIISILTFVWGSSLDSRHNAETYRSDLRNETKNIQKNIKVFF